MKFVLLINYLKIIKSTNKNTKITTNLVPSNNKVNKFRYELLLWSFIFYLSIGIHYLFRIKIGYSFTKLNNNKVILSS